MPFPHFKVAIFYKVNAAAFELQFNLHAKSYVHKYITILCAA